MLLEKEKAFEVLDFSRCSPDYKNYCKRIDMFPMRTGIKTRRKNGEVVEVREAPQLLLRL